MMPYIPAQTGSSVYALLQIEDLKTARGWEPALAMFGGKVSAGDKDWTHTAVREMGEECGAGDSATAIAFEPLRQLVTSVRTISDLPNLHGASSVWVPESKYEVLFLPVEDLPELLDLPILYWEEFHGRNSNDIHRGDWSRAAYSLVWVELDFNPGCCHITTRNLDDVVSPGEGQTRDAARFPRPWALPHKVELQGALRGWAGPAVN